MVIGYFGTSLDSAGHYMWELNDNRLKRPEISYVNFFENCFDPESIADKNDRSKKRSNGDVFYFRENGFTIVFITGSCIDKRHGCKSVFFTKESITFGEFVLKIISVPIAKQIITKMPFKINWKLTEEYIQKINLL